MVIGSLSFEFQSQKGVLGKPRRDGARVPSLKVKGLGSPLSRLRIARRRRSRFWFSLARMRCAALVTSTLRVVFSLTTFKYDGPCTNASAAAPIVGFSSALFECSERTLGLQLVGLMNSVSPYLPKCYSSGDDLMSASSLTDRVEADWKEIDEVLVYGVAV